MDKTDPLVALIEASGEKVLWRLFDTVLDDKLDEHRKLDAKGVHAQISYALTKRSAETLLRKLKVPDEEIQRYLTINQQPRRNV
jgi:hypothetical protein